MARFRLKPYVTDKQVGSLIRELASKPPAQGAPGDANNFFSSVFDIPAGTTIQLVFDTEKLRHVVVPYYPKPPSSDVDELLGVVTVRGCGD